MAATARPPTVGERPLNEALDRQGKSVVSEVQRRAERAIAAIRAAFGTEADEYGATLFVSHHLAELPKEYWLEQLGSAAPSPAAVLDLLTLKSSWGDEDDDGLENFDFTLPGEVTNYVISAHFDDTGEVDAVSMES
jgi:hypothetical protein